jgi:hypothetical protein
MITKQGREIATQLTKAGAAWHWEQQSEMLNNVSLICRHAKTYRRLAEMECGDGIHSGEWVNDNYDWITKRNDQIEARLAVIAKDLPSNVRLQLDGDPRAWVVRLIITDNLGVERTVGID